MKTIFRYRIKAHIFSFLAEKKGKNCVQGTGEYTTWRFETSFLFFFTSLAFRLCLNSFSSYSALHRFWQHVFHLINFKFYCSYLVSFTFFLRPFLLTPERCKSFCVFSSLARLMPQHAICAGLASFCPRRMEICKIYATLVSEILKYYDDVEDINGNDYDEFESARNITEAFVLLMMRGEWAKRESFVTFRALPLWISDAAQPAILLWSKQLEWVGDFAVICHFHNLRYSWTFSNKTFHHKRFSIKIYINSKEPCAKAHCIIKLKKGFAKL